MPGLFCVALLVRLPTLGLPLEGASAILASVADQLSRGRGWELAGQAPLLPLLSSILVGLGLSATSALRLTDVLLASSLAPLLLVLLRRLGHPGKLGVAAGLLMAVHPLGVLGAGGLQPSGGSAAGALLLAALCCLLATGTWQRRTGAVLTLLLCGADPAGLIFVPLLLWLYARTEEGTRVQTGFVLVGCLLFVGAPLLWLDLLAGPSLRLGEAALWVLVAGLAVLLPALPYGLAGLWSSGRAARVWLVGGGVSLLSAILGGPVFSLGLLPLVVAGCVLGVPLVYAGSVRRMALGTVTAAALLAVWIAHGGLPPGQAPEGAGRLHLLRTALASAAATAGADGWIVLAVAEDRPAEQASLADLAPGHWTWARRAVSSEGSPDDLRRLLVFPAANFEPGRSFAVLAEAGKTGAIETFEGAGIYEQEVIRQIGPYVVLRARRP